MRQRAQIEHSLIKTYRSRFWSPFIRAIKEYELILPGDRIAVMLSGEKTHFYWRNSLKSCTAMGRRILAWFSSAWIRATLRRIERK